MKKFYKVFLAAFIIIALPILVACAGGNVSGEKKSFNLSIDIVSLENAESVIEIKETDNLINNSENFYEVNIDQSVCLYIDSHSNNILNKLEENTQVTLTFYSSFLSSDFSMQFNGQGVEYEIIENDDYQVLEYTVVITENSTLSLSGCFFML